MKIARKLLDQYWDGRLPVNPARLAEAMGVRVISDPSLGALSGKYEVEDGIPTIRFNPNEPLVRQRFTLAHELGHHVLAHGKAFRDPVAHFSIDNFDPDEVAANRFSAELLMPADIIEQQISTTKKATISGLASMFAVSEVAMRFRLKNLGWLSYA